MTEDIDALFAEITSGLDMDVAPDVLDVSQLSTMDLTRRMTNLRTELLARGEYIHPTSDDCREMHSELAACKIEMARRARER